MTHDKTAINADMQREILRRSRFIIIGWTVAIIAIWCCAYIALDNQEATYKSEDRV